jgi:hypothetical protein
MSLNEVLHMLDHLRLCPTPFSKSAGLIIFTNNTYQEKVEE